jgi:hypothetical protein
MVLFLQYVDSSKSSTPLQQLNFLARAGTRPSLIVPLVAQEEIEVRHVVIEVGSLTRRLGPPFWAGIVYDRLLTN